MRQALRPSHCIITRKWRSYVRQRQVFERAKYPRIATVYVYAAISQGPLSIVRLFDIFGIVFFGRLGRQLNLRKPGALQLLVERRKLRRFQLLPLRG